jgi:hypothetical protein
MASPRGTVATDSRRLPSPGHSPQIETLIIALSPCCHAVVSFMFSVRGTAPMRDEGGVAKGGGGEMEIY